MTATLVNLDLTEIDPAATGMPWIQTDGGRMASGRFKKRYTGDCVTRALAIAEEIPYLLVYRELGRRMQMWGRKGASNGVYTPIYENMMREAGYTTIDMPKRPTIVNADLPTKGTICVLVKNVGRRGRRAHGTHLFTMIDGTIHDSWNPSAPIWDGSHYEIIRYHIKPKASTLRTLVRGAAKPVKPKRETKMTKVEGNSDDMKVGKAWREVDLAAFKAWGKAAGTWSRAAAGAHLKTIDSDFYATLLAR